MPPRKLYFENVRLGDELPAMAKAPVDRVQLARYAAATNDYNPLNVDEVQAKATGMPSVVAPSTLGLGFLGQLVTDWARGTSVKKTSARFTRMLWPGDTLVCRGRVTDRWADAGKYFVEIELWAENQRGELVVRGSTLLKLFYSLEDETRFRAGQSPLIVNVPRQSLVAPSVAAPASAKAVVHKPSKVVEAIPEAPGKPKKAGKKAQKPKPKSKPSKGKSR